jgi:hypothetical protein
MAEFHSFTEALAADPESVTTLIVDANRGEIWQEWPAELWTLTHLEVLRLTQTLLYRVPSELRALQRLRELELHGRFTWFEPGLGDLADLRRLILHVGKLELPREITKLTLDRLEIWGDWTPSLDVIAKIPVRTNVTLIDAHPDAASLLEEQDLSAWRELEELEIDAFEDFEPTVFERKLRRCGFAINRKRKVDWTI